MLGKQCISLLHSHSLSSWRYICVYAKGQTAMNCLRRSIIPSIINDISHVLELCMPSNCGRKSRPGLVRRTGEHSCALNFWTGPLLHVQTCFSRPGLARPGFKWPQARHKLRIRLPSLHEIFLEHSRCNTWAAIRPSEGSTNKLWISTLYSGTFCPNPR